MANRYAVASGNWSNPAIWDGGTLPTSADTVRPNGFTVTIDTNVTVINLINNASSPAVAGGTFNLNSGVTLTATLSGVSASTTNILNVNYNTGSSTIIGNIESGNLSVVANVAVGGNGTLNIIGNINGNNFSSGTLNRHGITVNSNATINITGNLNGSNLLANCHAIITGNLATVNPTINVTGNITANPGGSGIVVQSGTPTINLNGSVFGNASFSAIVGGSIAQTGNLLIQNPSSRLAIFSNFMILNTNFNTEWQFQSQTIGQTRTLYTPGSALGNPAITDVRSGVTYASGALTGTLVVPSPANVRIGVPTDNTVGTADLTAQDFFTAIANSSDPIAVRLRNVATVQTTGDQIAAAL